ncbi:adhesin [Pseudoxanthomonas daejeonensis]|uniref:adhesin n=1 Tax=Pseudoxanthomonas daejeonensis TaxID=266062 RepID=UPI001F546E12|nr:adhesin [Pseudoxanthomonas daejeonensis]UNK58739.1 adhesin [Pseudoxanthomonas daejeonensis]
MKRTVKWTVLAVAIAAATAANAETTVDNNIVNNWTTNTTIDTDIDTNLSKTKSYTSTVDKSYTSDVDKSYSSDVSKTYTSDVSKTVDLSYSDSFDRETTATHSIDTSYSDNFEKNTTINKNVDLDWGVDYQRNVVDTDITHDEDVNVDHDITIDKAVDEHGVSAELESDLSLTSDIDFTGNPTVSGDLEIDSAAIAVIDNRQSNSGNLGLNDTLTNDASIADNTATAAEGNLQFNVAAGDNNQQDNAAALSAADASFAFGLADSKVLVQQTGTGNATGNLGQTNTAGVGDAAFADATGNIGVNVTSGNNNQQKNSLAASVATSKYASAAVSSNQSSSGNFVTNAPKRDVQYDTVRMSLSGRVSGGTVAVGLGGYEGTASGDTSSEGDAYQQSNLYADTWTGATHSGGNQTGHIDFDAAAQGAVANPDRQGVGGFAFDTSEEGSYEGTEEGDLGFVELGYADLWASLSGTLQIARNVITTDATNTASLSGDAFARASGNIGVNVSAGTGNQQANSLSMAVAQPSTAPTGGGGGGE